MIKPALIPAFILFLGASLAAQSGAGARPVPEPYRADEFPPFLQAARRFEIVAIGSFPLTLFYSTFCYDSYRLVAKSAESGIFESGYLPWPLKGPDAVPFTREEQIGVLLAAASASLVVGILDIVFLRLQEAASKRRIAVLGMSASPPVEAVPATEDSSDPDPPLAGEGPAEIPEEGR